MICNFVQKKIYECSDEDLCQQDPATNQMGWTVNTQYKMSYTKIEIERK
jgi:hypothetical protein